MNRVLAVDLGGTKTAVGVVDADGKIIAKETAPTTLGSFQATINLVIRLSRAVIEKAGAVTALGVALPGIVDREKVYCCARPRRDGSTRPSAPRSLPPWECGLNATTT